jgi:hypothetical protein
MNIQVTPVIGAHTARFTDEPESTVMGVGVHDTLGLFLARHHERLGIAAIEVDLGETKYDMPGVDVSASNPVPQG